MCNARDGRVPNPALVLQAGGGSAGAGGGRLALTGGPANTGKDGRFRNVFRFGSLPFAVVSMVGCSSLAGYALIEVMSNNADKGISVIKEVLHDNSKQISMRMKDAAEAHGRGMTEVAGLMKEAAEAHGQRIK